MTSIIPGTASDPPSPDEWAKAIQDGDEPRMRQWLATAPPCVAMCQDGLESAISWGREGIVEQLLRYLDRQDLAMPGPRALWMAAQYGRVNIVHLLLPWCDVQQRDGDGQTVLHLAARNKHSTMVRTLLPLLPATTVSSSGTLALHDAAGAGAMGVIELLLPHGGTNHRDHHGATPLLHAVRAYQTQAVERLAPLTDMSLRYNGHTAQEFAGQLSAMSHGIRHALDMATRRWEAEQLRAVPTLETTSYSGPAPRRPRL